MKTLFSSALAIASLLVLSCNNNNSSTTAKDHTMMMDHDSMPM